MEQATCQVCGYKGKPETVARHHIIPRELTEQAGMPDSATVMLCRNCSQELNDWYSKRAFNMAYDPASKRFRPRLPHEMVREYETAYRAFAKYKKLARSKV